MTQNRTTAGQLGLLGLCLVLLSGCSSTTSPDESPYLSPTSPENVLANFATAYEERDLDEYLSCLSEDFKFLFTVEDQQGWPQLPPWFYRSDEEQVHENMFGDDYDVESIFLALTPTETETIPASALTGETVRMRTDADLRITLTGDLTYAATTPQDFYFRVVEEERDGRDHEYRWELFEWHDLEDGDAARVEEAGWGGIKYVFLEELTHEARRTSPEDVIEQLREAYAAMDAADYLDCLSGEFVFYPCEFDVNDPGTDIPEEWYRADEVTIHTNMFAPESAAESVSATFSNESWDHDTGADPQDPSDDTHTCTCDVDVRVNLAGGLTLLAGHEQEFTIQADQDEVGPYDELMWDVHAWDELDTWAGREEQTWGGIKWMFR